jgi:hypothetical protein
MKIPRGSDFKSSLKISSFPSSTEEKSSNSSISKRRMWRSIKEGITLLSRLKAARRGSISNLKGPRRVSSLMTGFSYSTRSSPVRMVKNINSPICLKLLRISILNIMSVMINFKNLRTLWILFSSDRLIVRLQCRESSLTASMVIGKIVRSCWSDPKK